MVTKDSWKELEKKVDFLRDPHSYSHHPKSVEVFETHMSYVFVAGEFSFKIKKPNSFPFLHLESLKDRFENIHQEYSLNKSLAPGFYLKVIPLLETNDEELVLEEEKPNAKIVEWVLKMKTYPREICLDQLIKKNKIPEQRLIKAFDKLFHFYHDSRGVDVNADFFMEFFYQTISDVKVFIHQFGNQEKFQLMTKILRHQEEFLLYNSYEIRDRVDHKLIVEGHGDLRPEHICLMEDPILVDCLEFNQRLRTLDPLDEIACLDLECELLGNHHIGKMMLHHYQQSTHDQFDMDLYYFYKIQRALIRAKLCLGHTQDQFVKTKEVWGQKCEDYLKLAESYLNKAPNKILEVPPPNPLPSSFSSP